MSRRITPMGAVSASTVDRSHLPDDLLLLMEHTERGVKDLYRAVLPQRNGLSQRRSRRHHPHQSQNTVSQDAVWYGRVAEGGDDYGESGSAVSSSGSATLSETEEEASASEEAYSSTATSSAEDRELQEKRRTKARRRDCSFHRSPHADAKQRKAQRFSVNRTPSPSSAMDSYSASPLQTSATVSRGQRAAPPARPTRTRPTEDRAHGHSLLHASRNKERARGDSFNDDTAVSTSLVRSQGGETAEQSHEFSLAEHVLSNHCSLVLHRRARRAEQRRRGEAVKRTPRGQPPYQSHSSRDTSESCTPSEDETSESEGSNEHRRDQRGRQRRGERAVHRRRSLSTDRQTQPGVDDASLARPIRREDVRSGSAPAGAAVSASFTSGVVPPVPPPLLFSSASLHGGVQYMQNESSGMVQSARTTAQVRSRFGQRWGAAFQRLATEPAQPPPTTMTNLVAAPRPAPPLPTAPAVEAKESAVKPSSNNDAVTAAGTVPSHMPTRPEAAAAPSSTLSSVPAPLPASPSQAVPSALLAARDAVVAELKEELQNRERALLRLRLDHATEIATLKESIATARVEAAQETTAQLNTSFSLKEKLLQTELEGERQKTSEALEQVRHVEQELQEAKRACDARRMDLESEQHTRQLREAELRAAQSRIHELQQSVSRSQAAAGDVVKDLHASQQQCHELGEAASAMERRVHEMESQLVAQEETAKSALQQLEGEFTTTMTSYQQLLTEATDKMAHLEKVQRKYRVLKESQAVVKDQQRRLEDELERQRAAHDSETERYREEVATLRSQLAQREEEMKAAAAAHANTLDELQRRLELHSSTSTEQVRTLQQHVETANHTIQLLRTQVESLKNEVLDEQRHGQEVAMRMAEQELRLTEERNDAQKAGAAFKLQSEETITALKRQLREKDAKLQSLAASAAEPVQKLRTQLEAERSRRALVEEQFARYKKRAKEAEEAALREMRREQLRATSLVNAAAAVVEMQQQQQSARGGGAGSHVVSVSPTSPTSSPRWSEGSHGASHPAAAASRSQAWWQTRSPIPPSSTGPSRRSGSPRTVSSGSPRTQPTQPVITLSAPSTAATASADGTGHSPPQVQTTNIGVQPVRMPTIDTPPRQRVTSTTTKSPSFERCHTGEGETEGTARHTPRSGDPTPFTSFDANRSRERRDQPSHPSPHGEASVGDQRHHRSASDGAHNGSREGIHGGHRNSPSHTGAPLPSSPRPAIGSALPSPGGTVGSLSGISPNSPCKSTSQLGGSVRSEGETAAQIMMVASLDAAADRPSAARARTLPPPPSPPAPPFMDTEAQHRSQPRRAPREGAEAGSVNEMERDGSGLIDHERRLSEFQSSAADIFRRITGSREEFLAQCASLVRRTRYTGPEKEKAPRRQRPFAMGVDGPFLTRRGGADNEDRSSSEGDE